MSGLAGGPRASTGEAGQQRTTKKEPSPVIRVNWVISGRQRYAATRPDRGQAQPRLLPADDAEERNMGRTLSRSRSCAVLAGEVLRPSWWPNFPQSF